MVKRDETRPATDEVYRDDTQLDPFNPKANRSKGNLFAGVLMMAALLVVGFLLYNLTGPQRRAAIVGQQEAVDSTRPQTTGSGIPNR